MIYSLKTKLSLSYILVAILSVLLIMVLTNILLDKHFRDYVKQNQEQSNKTVVTSFGQQYSEDGKWNMTMVESIGVNALENGLIIKVKDASGKIIWDATVHNNGMCQRIIEHMARNVNARYPNAKETFSTIPHPVYSKGAKVGIVEIGSYGSYYLNDNDLAFINTFNSILIGVGIFSLVFSLLLGGVMARRISMPVSRVIHSAQSIAKGYFSDRISEKSNTEEMQKLTETINHLAETLEKQEGLRKQMTDDVAHELRTPLATLQSHIEAMIDGVWKPDLNRLTGCFEEIIRINKLVGDLETLAKYDSETKVLEKENFDAYDLLKRMILHIEPEFQNKRIDLSFAGEKAILFADQDKIKQVVTNLLSNALKYTAAGGQVYVSVKDEEKAVEISVKDTGEGIATEDLPFIFERFYRADKSRNRMTGGAGIGLSITKAIVDAHQGTIVVQSQENEGTAFVVKIPKVMK